MFNKSADLAAILNIPLLRWNDAGKSDDLVISGHQINKPQILFVKD